MRFVTNNDNTSKHKQIDELEVFCGAGVPPVFWQLLRGVKETAGQTPAPQEGTLPSFRGGMQYY